MCRIFNRVLRPLRPLMDRLADWYFRDCRVVPDTHDGHSFYTALLAEASV